MKDSDYPTETVSLEFFGGKEVTAGMRETVEVVSVDDSVAQIRCTGKGKKGERPSYAKEVSEKYRGQMAEGES